MSEHQLLSYKQVIGLGMIPIMWGFLSAAPVNVKADDFTSAPTQNSGQPSTAQSDQQSTTDTTTTDQSAVPQAETADSTASPKQPVASTEASDASTTDADQAAAANNADPQTPSDNATSSDASNEPAQPDKSASSADSDTSSADATTDQAGTDTTETETTDSPTTSNGITNPNKSADKTAATKDQAAQLNALVKQYLATYNRQHNTAYQLSDTTILANTIENNLTDTQSQVADQQTIYNNLNTLLDKMIADNRLYLLQNFHGVDIAFNLVTNGTIYTNVAKSLVIPIYIQTTDSNGNQIGELIPVTDANGNSLQYGGSWSTLAPTLADYQLTSNAAAASSGAWNAGFDYGQLNAKGELIIKYVYTKIPVTPIIPITPIAPVEPDVPQPTPTQPPVLTQQITSQPTTLSPNIVFENPTPVSEPVTITRPAFKPNHNDYTSLPNRQPKQPPDTREAIALRDLVQTNPFTLIAQYTIPVVRTASRVANPVASQATAKAQPESQVASVPYIQPRLDATEQPLIVRNAALDLAASTVQAQNKLTNPIIKPHQPAREFPGGLPGHTQLGVFFSILSGKVNFGTTTDEENKL